VICIDNGGNPAAIFASIELPESIQRALAAAGG